MRARGFLAKLLPPLCCCAVVSFGVPDGPLPPAKDVVAHYDEALGGRNAILRHTSTTMRGTLTVQESGHSTTLSFVYLAGAPFRRLERVSLPNGIGDILNGFDGGVAWSFDPRTKSAQIYDGNDRESMKRDADYYYPLNELSWFKSMETVGQEDFEGKRCFRLHGINDWSKANDHLYDSATGLLVAYDFVSDFGPTHEIFSDYRRIDGVLFPMKQTVKTKAAGNQQWVVRQVLDYTSVTFNDVDPAAFTPPQAVRDLLTKRKGSPAESK